MGFFWVFLFVFLFVFFVGGFLVFLFVCFSLYDVTSFYGIILIVWDIPLGIWMRPAFFATGEYYTAIPVKNPYWARGVINAITLSTLYWNHKGQWVIILDYGDIP